jgi:thiosulfate/3-mercaptopyruvate sulfurtransferase
VNVEFEIRNGFVFFIHLELKFLVGTLFIFSMRKIFITQALILLFITILSAADGFPAKDNPDKVMPLVSSSWLKENMTNPEIVILHVSATRLDYDNGHIPDAGFLWPGYVNISTENESTVPAPAADIAKLLRSLGVNNNSHIVLCGKYGNIIPVCRIFVNLEHIGLKGRVSILDGGFDAWAEAGYEISTQKYVTDRGKFKPSVNNNLVDGSWVLSNLENKSYCIIDARAKAQYDGTAGLPRAGHIKGAKNVAPTEIYDAKTTRFFDKQKLTETFIKLDIPANARPVFYCNTGNSASAAYLAAIIAGYDPIVYDGSMEEWSSKTDLPMEK